jgi:iron-sulfur cluster assembly protein
VNLADKINDKDIRIETRGINIVIDDQSFRYLNGTELDYVREGLNEGFRFKNPNVAETCGCGESFSMKEAEQQV